MIKFPPPAMGGANQQEEAAMADADTDASDNTDADDTADNADGLGDGGKAAIAAERKARRDAEKQLKTIQAELQSLKDKDLSEADQLRKQIGELTKERDEHNARALRLEVAAAKGLTPAQAKRLVGTTVEELEADADEILEAFPAQKGATPPPSNKPKPDLRGGGDPTDEPIDVKALVDSIPPTY